MNKYFDFEKSIEEIVVLPSVDVIVTATSGDIALVPTLIAIDNKKNIALANKESIVIAGKELVSRAKENNVDIFPLDSEPNAIWQCLKGEQKAINKLIITASGGALRDFPLESLSAVTPSQALNHPTWKMGPKNTIDSATLMNKALEVIEASVLFSMSSEKIEGLVHPESIVPGMVSLIDGGVISYFSQTDMRVPIFNAMNFPKTRKHFIKPPNFTQLNFHELNERIFPSVSLARLASVSYTHLTLPTKA